MARLCNTTFCSQLQSSTSTGLLWEGFCNPKNQGHLVTSHACFSYYRLELLQDREEPRAIAMLPCLEGKNLSQTWQRDLSGGSGQFLSLAAQWGLGYLWGVSECSNFFHAEFCSAFRVKDQILAQSSEHWEGHSLPTTASLVTHDGTGPCSEAQGLTCDIKVVHLVLFGEPL